MKFVVWLIVLFVGTLLNELLYFTVGIKLGYLLLYLLLSAIAKAICKAIGNGSDGGEAAKPAAGNAAMSATPIVPDPPVWDTPSWEDKTVASVPDVKEPEPVFEVPQPKAASVLLTLISGPKAGTKFRCREGMAIMVGRNPAKSNLALKDYKLVSGVHCRVDVTGSGMTVMDMGSVNGTYVDGVKLTPHTPEFVRDGAQIQLANRECVFTVKFE